MTSHIHSYTSTTLRWPWDCAIKASSDSSSGLISTCYSCNNFERTQIHLCLYLYPYMYMYICVCDYGLGPGWSLHDLPVPVGSKTCTLGSLATLNFPLCVSVSVVCLYVALTACPGPPSTGIGSIPLTAFLCRFVTMKHHVIKMSEHPQPYEVTQRATTPSLPPKDEPGFLVE